MYMSVQLPVTKAIWYSIDICIILPTFSPPSSSSLQLSPPFLSNETSPNPGGGICTLYPLFVLCRSYYQRKPKFYVFLIVFWTSWEVAFFYPLMLDSSDRGLIHPLIIFSPPPAPPCPPFCNVKPPLNQGGRRGSMSLGGGSKGIRKISWYVLMGKGMSLCRRVCP